MASSGRKNRVVVSCVTLDTLKITEPIKYYEATHVHLIGYVADPNSQKGRTYKAFYDRVREIIDEETDAEVYDHTDAPVYYFTDMLRAILKIIEKEDEDKDEHSKSDIYLNISGGSSEYAAAAVVASMMTGAKAFSVGTKEHTIPFENYYKDGKPLGESVKVTDPFIIPRHEIEMPSKKLIKGLRILNDRNKKWLPVTSTKMVAEFIKEGIWTHRKPDYVTKDNRSNAVYYQRDFISKWLKNNWIEMDHDERRYVVTEEGKRYMETFYTDD